ncbi:N-acetylmuramoyl-L-alanine amidase family protein [Hydrogenothermus marinus]|uniref:N-acetylmuramoyl-L-alanine amidase n=1 Tax=Hydrogenothermus marinus TaxID=133270 RepID=A0A3M0BZE2_9AQUI|nr:N-acetylmuramoyl-L-alanine amidase [Hydrogenothermus marinus]RMA96052.1 N-acetylmuramoyl-L-alanine amidase [Hydrogenothermus marinus]
MKTFKFLIIFQLLIFNLSVAGYLKAYNTENGYKVVINAYKIQKIPFFDENYLVFKIKDKNFKLKYIKPNKKYVKDISIIKSKDGLKLVIQKTKRYFKLKKYKNGISIIFFEKKHKNLLKKTKYSKKISDYERLNRLITKIITGEKEDITDKPQIIIQPKLIKRKQDPLYDVVIKELNKEQIIKPIVIVIDPGHGGKDPGAIANGVKEKDITLKLAKILKRYLEKDKVYKVYLTRNTDRYVGLYERTLFAIKKHADIFISIHCNTNPNPKINGTYIYTLSLKGAKSKLARLVEKRENKAVIKLVKVSKNTYVNNVVAELAINTTMTEGRNFAYILKNQLKKITKVRDIDSANFAVLKTPGIPSVLIETAFLTNKEDIKKLKNERFLKRFAKEIYNAIDEYFFNYHNLVLK